MMILICDLTIILPADCPRYLVYEINLIVAVLPYSARRVHSMWFVSPARTLSSTDDAPPTFQRSGKAWVRRAYSFSLTGAERRRVCVVRNPLMAHRHLAKSNYM